MTAREVYEYALIELNKRKAPSLLLADYVYYINKAIQQYVNKMYNLYEVDQQKSDDLKDLIVEDYEIVLSGNKGDLPDDYLHILKCISEYKVLSDNKCYKEDDIITFGTKRLTSDAETHIENNYYFKPKFNQPYFKIRGKEIIIKWGSNPKFSLEKIYMDYIKTPSYIDLTQEQIDSVIDNSDELEFSEYVCQEIVNELVKLVLENSSDPRLQTNPIINQTISNPGLANNK